ncbi:hypothetical protein PENARI_c003G11800 [Penicillium arizonense]|uniref:Uncharacterized protein n=1 Tax=Penicillium arizonense TaxID=1835702 RepID=A0A1F5LSZ1_PENAI|nr:hypothetical protein PENARI_c003G11800 [Penicillium arizonense]OGE56324.1 hypothetical protein PENARI_c003G11800 [Penicillium arizonense]
MDIDEGYEADDESSKPRSGDTTTAISSPPVEIQGVFHFKVHRECSTMSGSSGEVSQWINASYFLWKMCATLADTAADPEWTEAFELWRSTWDQIQEELLVSEDTGVPVKIPPAPVNLASVQPGSVSLRGSEKEDWVIEIEQEDDGMLYDNQDIWALWRRVVESPAGPADAFCVILKETARICPLA